MVHSRAGLAHRCRTTCDEVLKSELTVGRSGDWRAQQTNDVSRGAEADVYIVTVIYFRSNEKARFKKRALS